MRGAIHVFSDSIHRFETMNYAIIGFIFSPLAAGVGFYCVFLVKQPSRGIFVGAPSCPRGILLSFSTVQAINQSNRKCSKQPSAGEDV